MIDSTKSLLHWNYFIALEADLTQVARFIEFTELNYLTFSIELSHLLLSAGSEIDVVLKELCHLYEPQSKLESIKQYYPILEKNFSCFFHETVYIPRFKLEFKPWEKWSVESTPSWWQAYNSVKHERNEHFNDANLFNVLNCMSALLITIWHYYRLGLRNDLTCPLDDRQVSLFLKPVSQLLTFGSEHYFDRINQPI